VTLQEFVRAVRRHQVTFALVTAVVFVLGVIFIVLFPLMYVSTTRLMVSIDGSTTAAAYQNEDVAARRVGSYIPLLTSAVVTQRVVDKLGYDMTYSELAKKISATNVPPKSALIDVEVTDPSPDQARLIANTLATEFVAYTKSIETPTGEDDQRIHTTVVSAATDGHRNRLESFLLGLIAALVALLAGAIAVWKRAAREPALPDADHDTTEPETDPDHDTTEPETDPDHDTTEPETDPEHDTTEAETLSTEAEDHARHRARETPEGPNHG
jgi:capsular polysaccharide biosynthesis protein